MKQLWFEDVRSLAMKYHAISQMGLSGKCLRILLYFHTNDEMNNSILEPL